MSICNLVTTHTHTKSHFRLFVCWQSTKKATGKRRVKWSESITFTWLLMLKSCCRERGWKSCVKLSSPCRVALVIADGRQDSFWTEIVVCDAHLRQVDREIKLPIDIERKRKKVKMTTSSISISSSHLPTGKSAFKWAPCPLFLAKLPPSASAPSHFISSSCTRPRFLWRLLCPVFAEVSANSLRNESMIYLSLSSNANAAAALSRSLALWHSILPVCISWATARQISLNASSDHLLLARPNRAPFVLLACLLPSA